MIKLTEPLTKENFWNELQAKYPDAMKKFCDFVDEYKEAVGWKQLFNEVVRPDWASQAPKFHDLPFGLQIGIWGEFMTYIEPEGDFVPTMKQAIASYFPFEQVRINAGKEKVVP